MKKKSDCEHCEPNQSHKHKDVVSLVNRIGGQVTGIGKMIDDDRYCPDILNQVRAARSALRTLEARILRTHLQSCVRDAFTSGTEKTRSEKMDEIVTLFNRYESAED